MPELTFDIDDILEDSRISGVLTKKQISEIKSKRGVGTSPTSSNVGAAAQAVSQLSGGTDNVVGSAASGAAAGAALGPWGAALGGGVGAVQGVLQSDKNEEERKRQIEANRITSIANIQNQATRDRNSQINNIVSNLSQTLLR